MAFDPQEVIPAPEPISVYIGSGYYEISTRDGGILIPQVSTPGDLAAAAAEGGAPLDSADSAPLIEHGSQ